MQSGIDHISLETRKLQAYVGPALTRLRGRLPDLKSFELKNWHSRDTPALENVPKVTQDNLVNPTQKTDFNIKWHLN